jgi:rRNA maturation RNase YbeY
MSNVSIKNLTRRPQVPRFAYEMIAEDILPKWEVSLVFVGQKQAQELNQKLRGKTYTPNVLSYALGEKSGEIFICLREAEKQAPKHDMDSKTFILSLFIHGLLHIKGLAHGATMERCEKDFLARYAATNSNRH